MSLKSIELQVALPRTQDVGKLQEQHNQREVIKQHLDDEERKLQAEQERNKPTALEGTQLRRIGEEEENRKRQQGELKNREQNRKKKKKESPAQFAQHPYKGKHIDLSL